VIGKPAVFFSTFFPAGGIVAIVKSDLVSIAFGSLPHKI
jgi:hypothetical protein